MTSTPARTVVSWPLVAICAGYFMVILDTTVLTVALPALQQDLHASVGGLQWVVDSYLLALAATLLVGGAVSDRLGARRVFQYGLGLFVVASVACGLAPTVTVLVIARVAQGIGAAMAVPASLALLRAVYPDRRARAQAVGIWGAIAGVAAGGGPVLGGLLVSAVDWRLVFLVNVPIGLAAMVLTARFVPVARPTAGPGLALKLFRDRTFSGATVVGLLINLGFYGELFVMNLHFQHDRHQSAVVAGLAILPQMGVVALGSALSGRFTARSTGPRRTMLVGLAIGAAGFLGLAAVLDADYWLLMVPLVAVGFGMSFTMPAATTAVIDAAPDAYSGLASGVINTARQLGGVIGVALAGSSVSLIISGAAFVAGAVLTALTVRN